MIDMECVTRFAQVLLPGVPIYLSMSGGNCATIYVGEPYTGVDGGDYHRVIAGPGTFAPAPAEAYEEEFSVGWDQDLDSTAPDIERFDRPHPTRTRELRAARRIQQLYQLHPWSQP